MVKTGPGSAGDLESQLKNCKLLSVLPEMKFIYVWLISEAMTKPKWQWFKTVVPHLWFGVR